VLNTKEDILKNVVGNQTDSGPLWPPQYFFLLLFFRSQWGLATVWLPTFFKISFLCSAEERTWLMFKTTWGWV